MMSTALTDPFWRWLQAESARNDALSKPSLVIFSFLLIFFFYYYFSFFWTWIHKKSGDNPLPFVFWKSRVFRGYFILPGMILLAISIPLILFLAFNGAVYQKQLEISSSSSSSSNFGEEITQLISMETPKYVIDYLIVVFFLLLGANSFFVFWLQRFVNRDNQKKKDMRVFLVLTPGAKHEVKVTPFDNRIFLFSLINNFAMKKYLKDSKILLQIEEKVAARSYFLQVYSELTTAALAFDSFHGCIRLLSGRKNHTNVFHLLIARLIYDFRLCYSKLDPEFREKLKRVLIKQRLKQQEEMRLQHEKARESMKLNQALSF